MADLRYSRPLPEFRCKWEWCGMKPGNWNENGDACKETGKNRNLEPTQMFTLVWMQQWYACTGSPCEISSHTYELARLVYTQLSSWRHGNGQRLAELYHGTGDFMSSQTQGPIVNFNLLKADGSYVGYSQVKINSFCSVIKIIVHLVSEKNRQNW